MISTSNRAGFTLFELLVVIGMIAIIMGALSFSINSAVERAKILKTESEVKSITQTILAYENYAENYELPVYDSPVEANASTLGFLLGLKTDGTTRDLPVLLRAQLSATENQTVCDAWGTPYRITIRRGAITPPAMGSLQTGFSLSNFHRLAPEERK